MTDIGFLKRWIRINTIKKLAIFIPSIFLFSLIIQDKSNYKIIYAPYLNYHHQIDADEIKAAKQSDIFIYQLHDYQPEKLLPITPVDDDKKNDLVNYLAIFNDFAVPVWISEQEFKDYQQKGFLKALLHTNTSFLKSKYYKPDEYVKALTTLPILEDKILVGHDLDERFPLSIMVIVLLLLAILLTLYCLFIVIKPYKIKAVSELRNSYGLDIAEIESDISHDYRNKQADYRKGALIATHFAAIFTLRNIKIIPYSEVDKISFKHSIDFYAYLWWLPRIFIYVKETNRKYRIRCNKKRAELLLKAMNNANSHIDMPQLKKIEKKEESKQRLSLSPNEIQEKEAAELVVQRKKMGLPATPSITNNEGSSNLWVNVKYYFLFFYKYVVIDIAILLCTLLVSIPLGQLGIVLYIVLASLTTVIFIILTLIKGIKTKKIVPIIIAFLLMILLIRIPYDLAALAIKAFY